MDIQRPRYLQQLIDAQWDGQVKVITGLRRCGKSYLLRKLFFDHLLATGATPEDILVIDLDRDDMADLRHPLRLGSHAREWMGKTTARRYLFVDEIQRCESVPNPAIPEGAPITFYDTLNGLRSIENLDIYVTGSNSRMLSTDILTEFRGRSTEIRLHPLSFAEMLSAVGGDRRDALETYMRTGGMPALPGLKSDAARETYLQRLFSETYLRDIVERRRIDRMDVLEGTLDMLCSSVGSLTNPTNIARAMSAAGTSTSAHTVRTYIGHLTDAFLFNKCRRYDIKGKAYFDYPDKYYCEDVGLRNARLGWRQQEPTHLMENIICNELLARGQSVDVGIVPGRETDVKGNSIHVNREIDFVVNKPGTRVYIQSAWAMPDDDKRERELAPFSKTGDSFRKIVVRGDVGRGWQDDRGILHVGLAEFLLDETLV